MLVELSVMEQRYGAVLAVVQDGRQVTEVACSTGTGQGSGNTHRGLHLGDDELAEPVLGPDNDLVATGQSRLGHRAPPPSPFN